MPRSSSVVRPVLASLLLLAAFPLVSAAATYYVSPTGNDANLGTEASPWATFSKAWTTVRRGDTLVLLDGVYQQVLDPGAPALDPANPQYITVRAKNDGKAIIDGQSNSSAVFLRGAYLAVEGIVARRGTQVIRIEGDWAVLRRVSAYDGNVDQNSIGIKVSRASDVVIEDVVVGGTFRKGVEITGGARVTVRRAFVQWSQWDGREFCGITWPYGAALEIYDASDHTFENVIGYGKVPRYLIGLKQQNAAEPAQTVNNKVLGSVAIGAGKLADGTVIAWPTARPQPTECYQDEDIRTYYQSRSGFIVYGPGIIRDNLFQDILAYGNAGLGLAAEATGTTGWDGQPAVSGNIIRRLTARANGADQPDGNSGAWGGVNVDTRRADLNRFAAIEDSVIAAVLESWPSYPNPTTRVTSSLTGGGARLRNRYVNGVLTDEPLWPWPMEQRIQVELGVSVTNLVADIAPDQVGASPCSYTVSPTTITTGAGGGTASLTISTSSSCTWGSHSADPWVSLNPGSGTGRGSTTVSVGANGWATARSAVLSVAGQVVSVSQEAGTACSVTVSPRALSSASSGETALVSVTAPAGCNWTAGSSASWARVSPTSASGAASVTVITSANTSTSSRSAALTIAGSTVSLTQAASTEPCAYSVSPTSLSAPAGGGTTGVTIATGTGCGWTTSASQAWVTVSPANGSGGGSVSVSAAANTTTVSRVATVTVGGRSIPVTQAAAAPAGGLSITDVTSSPEASVGRYEKLEIRFQVQGSPATMHQWPYDPAPPSGVAAGVGITVDAVFTSPDGEQFVQPAFSAPDFVDEVRNGRDWHLPTGTFSWRVRFSPHRTGLWSYKLVARDRSGTAESAVRSFDVTPTLRNGFIRVSKADTRYFEFDDGALFTGMGFQFKGHFEDPSTKGGPEYATLAKHGVNFVRLWISSMFGSAWTEFIGGRNQYRGYLPYTGLMPYYDSVSGTTTLAMRIDYETAGDTGWFDACRAQTWNDPESVRPGTTYRIRVRYHAENIVGPRVAGSPYGFVVKLGGIGGKCYEPDSTGTRITPYGLTNTGWGYLEGTWQSGTNNFLPRVDMALENVLQGVVYVASVSLQEDLGGGSYGPELMVRSSMEHELYVPEEKAYAFDKIVAAAERNGVYLKLVVSDLNDKIYLKLDDKGAWASPDNLDGFYGLGRAMNKTRWLQQMWWRYLQARWGYSPSIHSWELTNEGDPSLVKHYELADEFGKFMHCRAFGVDPGPGDGAKCSLDHPNDHLVTTSFWQYFPASAFWASGKYPNVDYADVHAYVSTSYAPLAERERMQWDAAYLHLWHSRELGALRIGKPIVRGETGMDAPGQQTENALGLDRDTKAVWLHNFLWSGLDSGGLYELYWWNSHLSNTTVDHRSAYAGVQNFLQGIQLNKGGYVDWAGTASHTGLRVVGQKNPVLGAMHLWVQNRQHTWKNVVDGVAVAPVSGEVVVPGFQPGTTYWLQRWDTYAPGGRIASVESLVSDSQGNLRIAVSSLQTDVALKVSAGLVAPTNLRVIR